MRPRALLAAGAILLALPGAAHAQQVRGVVGDVTSGARLPGTLLVAVAADSAIVGTTLSDSAGVFVLDVPPGRELRLRVQHLGYGLQHSGPIALTPADTLELHIGLRPAPLALEGVTVQAVGNRNLQRFIRNQRTRFGHFLDPSRIARMPRISARDMLLRVPGVTLMPNGMGGVLAPARDERVTCAPHVYVDGWSLGGGSINAHVSAGTVRGVEVYRNPANAPPEYQRAFMTDCPVVVVWTDTGFGLEPPD